MPKVYVFKLPKNKIADLPVTRTYFDPVKNGLLTASDDADITGSRPYLDRQDVESEQSEKLSGSDDDD